MHRSCNNVARQLSIMHISLKRQLASHLATKQAKFSYGHAVAIKPLIGVVKPEPGRSCQYECRPE